MEMGDSNTEAQVSPTMVSVIWFVIMIHEICISASSLLDRLLMDIYGPCWSESCKNVHVTVLSEKLWSCDGVWILLDCIKGDE
jgi:hypothetical protein